jgi:mxaA protein
MTKLAKLLLAAFSLAWLACAHAEIIENDPRIKVSTIEPTRDVGYTVGDTLSRTVILEAPKSLQLIETSLPIAGNDKKRQGKGSGIEVREVTLNKSTGLDSNIYTLHLTYQLFTGGVVARPTSLPAEFVKFAGEGESFDFRIPSWSFRMSPLAVFGSVVVEKDMSGFRGPLLLDATRQYQFLWGLLGLLTISGLGLLYVLGTYTWLPRMGGPFARAYRDLKKLPATADGLSQGVVRMHQAFNATVGGSVFDSASFLSIRPAFTPAISDIDRFFSLSRTVFFEPGAPHGIDGDAVMWLRQFCRRCRDCERGLK